METHAMKLPLSLSSLEQLILSFTIACKGNVTEQKLNSKDYEVWPNTIVYVIYHNWHQFVKNLFPNMFFCI